MHIVKSVGWMLLALFMMVAGLGSLSGVNLLQAMSDEGAKPAPVSSPSGTGGPRMVALQADARGHFLTDIRINNQFVKTMVDTGASVVALTAEDARKIGLQSARSDGFSMVSTANGVVRVQRVRIPELRLQSLVIRDVEAVVMPAGAMPVTLLGMSFLKRLGSFEMQGKTLVLKQ